MDGSAFSKRVAAGVNGGVALATVIASGAEKIVLPAASRAIAVRVCSPSATVVVSQATEYGDIVSSEPICTPSAKNRTAATPVPGPSSAVAETGVVADTVVPPRGEVIVTAGGVMSKVGALSEISKASTNTKGSVDDGCFVPVASTVNV